MGAKMGFQGLLYYGVAGNSAGTLITNSRDITIDTDHESGETTERGDGTSPPIKTEDVTCITLQIEFTCLQKDDDATLNSLKAAAASGTPVALRGKDYAAGKGPDGDFNLKMSDGKPLKGEQTVKFTATPTAKAGRKPQAYV